MKVLHVNFGDLPGRRFNGFDLLTDLETFGVQGRQLVLHKQSTDARVTGLLDETGDDRIVAALRRVELRKGMDSLLPPWGHLVLKHPHFRAADVVHYHVVHLNMLSLLDLPELFAAKPSIWTFHDAWPLTGHCIQPGECDGWLSGCEPCPHLERPIAMPRDRASTMFALKQQVYSELVVDIVVASGFMRDLVRRSPLGRQFEAVHQIPFGIQAAHYLPDSERGSCRELLGIDRDHFVLMFRSTSMGHKGVDLLVEALKLHPPIRPTTLLTVDQKGVVSSLVGDYRLREMGWIDDDALFAQLLCACDVFAMPSLAEGFGFMALEAMAAGRPVVCFQDTAVATVTHAPECGLAVPKGDTRALRAAIDLLATSSAESARRGDLGRELARTEYDHARYIESLVSLYRHLAQDAVQVDGS